MNLTRIFIERATLAVVVFTVLVFLGLLSYQQLSYELVPKFSPPVITAVTLYPGASPAEVESSITRPIEDALSSVEEVDILESESRENLSLVRLRLNSGVEVDLILQSAQRKLALVLPRLPSGANAPTLSKFDFDDLPIMQLGTYAQMGETEFFDLVKNRILPALASVRGVASVKMIGGAEREIQVNIDADKLASYKLSLLQVQQMIQRSNLSFPAGKLQNADRQVLVRLDGDLKTLDELRELVVGTSRRGSPIKLGAVAEVRDAQKAVQAYTRTDGQLSIGLSLLKQSDANAVEVSKQVQTVIAELESQYAEQGLSFVIAQDSSEFTLDAADAVIFDLLLAVLLVSLVMLVFLHSLRNALIVLISIPTSIISTFIVMYLLGYSLNLMSLLGLSLAIGILVDDSIVIIENIYRHLEMGKSPRKAALEGRSEIGFTAISITLIDVVVFLPLALTNGLAADLMRQFCIVVVVSTLMSLWVSFTLVPLLASRFSRLASQENKTLLQKLSHGFENWLDSVVASLMGILRWAFRHKRLTLLLALILFASTIYLIPAGFIGTNFLDAGDRGEFILSIELPKNATLEQTHLATQQAEALIKHLPEVQTLFSTVGTSSKERISRDEVYRAEINVKLVPKEERNVSSALLARQLKAAIEQRLAGVSVNPVELTLVGIANRAPVRVFISGTDQEQLLAFTDHVRQLVEAIPGAVEVSTNAVLGNPELLIKIDRAKMARLGLDLGRVGATLRTAFNGNTDAQFNEGEYAYDIHIRLDEFDRRDREDLEQLPLVNRLGQTVRLGQFVRIEESVGPAVLERTQRKASMRVDAQVVGSTVGTVGREIKNQLAETEIPKGITITYGGDVKRQTEAFISMGFAFAASILFVYLIMVALYDSYVYPFVVLFSIPMATVGAFLALALTHNNLTIFTIMGLIMLVGLVGKNVILVVDFTNQLKAEGKKLQEALLTATELRFRPILMTNISMIIGLLPIALATGAGSEWKNGLAWALIGGLTSSMLLSLVVVPVVYYVLEKLLKRTP